MSYIFQFWKDFNQKLNEGVEDDGLFGFRPDVFHHRLLGREIGVQFMDNLQKLVKNDGHCDDIFLVFSLGFQQALLLLDHFHC